MLGLFIIVLYTLYIEIIYNAFCQKITLDISQKYDSWIERINLSKYYIDVSGTGSSTHFFCLSEDNTPIFRWIYDWETEQVVFLRIYDKQEYRTFKKEYNSSIFEE